MSPVKLILAHELVELFIQSMENVALFNNATWRHVLNYRTADLKNRTKVEKYGWIVDVNILNLLDEKDWKGQDTCRQGRYCKICLLKRLALYVIDKVC